MSQTDTDLQWMVALSLVSGVGPVTGQALLRYFGTAREVFRAGARELMQVPGIGMSRIAGFRDEGVMRRAEAEMIFMERRQVQGICLDDVRYPSRLKQCMDPPLVIYKRGAADLNPSRVVAVVGTRRITDYGRRICAELTEGLCACKDLLVVSGLAYGTDAEAHRNALKYGIPTAGILAHGLDRIYPPEHRALAADMLVQGAVLTEFPSGTRPEKSNFPVRNRIVAGMSDVTVVVESDLKGGALITAYLASGYNREVAVFPGGIYNAASAGCNRLIRKQVAALITSAADLGELMGWDSAAMPAPAQPLLLGDFALTETESRVLGEFSSRTSMGIEELSIRAGIPVSGLAPVLLELELRGLLISIPGNAFRLV